MFRVLIVALLLGGVLFGAVVYLAEVEIPGFTGRTSVDVINDPTTPKVALGEELYPPAAFPAFQFSQTRRRVEPVVLRGYIDIKDKQDVPSQVSGQVLFIGEGIPAGAVAAAGTAAFMVEPYAYTTILAGNQKHYQFYRRLYASQVVHGDQMLGMLDLSRSQLLVNEKATKIEFAKEDADAALAASEEADTRFTREEKLYKGGTGSNAADYGAARAAKKKFEADHRAKLVGIRLAEEELKQAQFNHRQQEIRNKIPYRNSVIKQIFKQTGDAVKEQETVMQVYSLDNLLAIALVEAQYRDRIMRDMNVIIEPTEEKSPIYRLPGAHRGEVTDVAITNDVDKPRVVSGSVDRTVVIWDPHTVAQPIGLPHKDVVRVVACSPIGAAHNLCLAGCADGSVYVWKLDRDALTDLTAIKPVTVIKTHDDAVTSVAFSPDGSFFATGSGDGSMALWNTAEGKLVYRLDHDHGVTQPHQGTITALHFTPQSRLVSASRDNTVRVWKLHEKGAELVGEPIGGRTGNVADLGVSQDGKWMLFDQGRTLQLMSVQHASTITTLQSPGSTTPFETLALFSPDASLLLTAGAGEGRMQLWKSPTETARGFEVRQFVPEEKLPPTCAAFAPRFGQSGEHRFAVSGSSNGYVYFWELPTKDDIAQHRIENVQIRVVGDSLDPSTRQMRIAAEVPNATGRLMPGRPVTIVIGEQE